MDPDANLREQREYATMLLQDLDREGFVPGPDFCFNAEQLANLVHALDIWMCKGGALPVQWKALR